MLCLRDFGAVGDGVTDDTAAYNAFMAALASSNKRRGYVPMGKYRLTSQPADISLPIVLDCDGPDLTRGTVILRDYNGTAGKGVFNIKPGANGSVIRDMAVLAAAGTNGGRMLSVVAEAAAPPPSFLSFENLYLSTYGADTCVNTVYVDGSARQAAPVGVRDVSFKNCHIFGSAGFSFVMNGVIGLSFKGGGVYAAGGANPASGAIQVTAPGAPFYSQYIDVDCVTFNGLNLTNVNGASFKAPIIGAVNGLSINTGSTVNGVSVHGMLCGSVVAPWTNSGIYRPGGGFATS